MLSKVNIPKTGNISPFLFQLFYSHSRTLIPIKMLHNEQFLDGALMFCSVGGEIIKNRSVPSCSQPGERNVHLKLLSIKPFPVLHLTVFFAKCSLCCAGLWSVLTGLPICFDGSVKSRVIRANRS